MTTPTPPTPRPPLLRSVAGGVLMGLANLVPGISGGTMLLAAGVYPAFVDGVAEVTTFRFRRSTIVTLGLIVGAALVAVVLLAGLVGRLVVDHRWIMYSLFIGLTLGGVPLLWRRCRPLDPVLTLAVLAGIAVMAVLALIEPGDDGGGEPALVMLFVAGIAGASAMVLPGVSGSYLLLVLGQYLAILGAIATLKDGLVAGDVGTITSTFATLVPFGVGVVAGVVGVSNLVKFLLHRFERPTLGVLLGLLLGAVIGLWPFQAAAAPEAGTTIRGQTVIIEDGGLVFAESGEPVEAKLWPTARFTPGPGHIAGAIGLIGLGFGASLLIARGSQEN